MAFSNLINSAKNHINGIKNFANTYITGFKRLGGYATAFGKNAISPNNPNSVQENAKTIDKMSNSLKTAYSTSAVKNEKNFNISANSNALNNAFTSFINSQSSAQKQMDFQKEQSDLAWKRSQSSAQKQMDFQKEMWNLAKDYNTEMANTSFQRQVADLRKAGLNPILAVQNGGASAPTMSVPSGASSSAQAMSGASASMPYASTFKEDYGAIGEDKDFDWLNGIIAITSNAISSGLKTMFYSVFGK